MYCITPIDGEKLELSRFSLDPFIDSIEGVFKEIRDVYDQLWNSSVSLKGFESLHQKIVKYKSQQNSVDLTSYPVGFCFPITQFCFAILTEYPQYLSENTRLITDYLSRGGTLKIIWGDLRSEYFQTAIQLGVWYIDVAYDAIDRNKPKVRCARFSDSGFKDIASLSQYISIKEPYHKGKVYVNNLFPRLFPKYPLLFLSDDGRLSIDDSPYFSMLGERSKEWLEEYFSSDKVQKLPKSTIDQVAIAIQKFSKNYLLKELILFEESTPQELMRNVDHDKTKLSPEKTKAVNNVNFVLSTL